MYIFVSVLLSLLSFASVIRVAGKLGRSKPVLLAIVFHIFLAPLVLLISMEIFGSLYSQNDIWWVFSGTFLQLFWSAFLWAGAIINTFLALIFLGAKRSKYLAAFAISTTLTIAIILSAFQSTWVDRKLSFCGSSGVDSNAISACNEVLASDSPSKLEKAHALIERAEHKSWQGDFGAVVDDYSLAFRYLQNDYPIEASKIAVRIASLELHELDQFENAIRYLDLAIELDDDGYKRYERSWAYFRSGKVDAALSDISKAIGSLSDRRLALALLRRGLYAAFSGNSALALSSLEDAQTSYEFKPDYLLPERLFAKVQIYKIIGDQKKSFEALQQFLELIVWPRELSSLNFSREKSAAARVLGQNVVTDLYGKLTEEFKDRLRSCFQTDACYQSLMSEIAEFEYDYVGG
jgi:tetratricopeptide (TPR) repeat protein